MAIGRNEPCPCGSGKKYKTCCLSRAPAGGYTRQQRSSAATKLDDFICETLGQEDDEAFAELWGPWADTDDDLPAAQSALSEYVCDLWFAFDRPLADGRLVIDRFLEARGRLLSGGELAYLKALRTSSLRLYEIEDTRPGDSLTMRDLVEGDVVTVQEKSGSRGLARRDWLAARVVIGASGRLELEGLLPYPALVQQPLRERVREGRDAFLKGHPGAPVDAFYKAFVPKLHQLWLGCAFEPMVPQLANTDGEELVITRVTFEVRDLEAMRAKLDAVEALTRGEGAQDVWRWQGVSKAQPVSLGLLTVKAGLLTIEANSVARGARGRALVEGAAGAAVQHRSTTHEDLQRAVRERLKSGASAESSAEPDFPFEVQEALSLDAYARHYHGWLDEQVPALEGKTPRQASADQKLRPKLVELLHGLGGMYQRALMAQEPAFDGSWLWDELGLEGPAAQHPPPLAHERLGQLVPGSADVALQLAEALRRAPGFDDAATVVSAESLRDNLHAQRFLREAPAAPPGSQPLAQHLEVVVGFELHRRKAFWVDPPLAYMLARTELDVRGEELRTPFPSFALIFTDRHVLSLAERHLSRQVGCPIAGQYLQVVTAFVTERHQGDARSLSICFACDALGADLPWLVSVDLPLTDGTGVEAHIDTLAPRVIVEPAVPDANPLRGLLQVTVNAMLYATSADVKTERRDAPSPRARPRSPKGGPEAWSSESVFFLPGAIEISQVRRLQQLERLGTGRDVLRRFMVRGHWRRAVATWADQRLRWVRPHWKGPDMATVIERTYKLKE